MVSHRGEMRNGAALLRVFGKRVQLVFLGGPCAFLTLEAALTKGHAKVHEKKTISLFDMLKRP